MCHSSTTITSCCSMIMHGPMLQGSVHNSWKLKTWPAYSPDMSPIEHVLDALDHIKSNQIKSLLLSHHHSTSALVSEILMRWTDSAKKNNNNNLHMDRQCKKKKKTTTTIYIWTDSAKKTTNNLHMNRQCKKAALEHLQCSRQCKKTTTIYIWTVHIYRLYRRQCAKYTYIYSVHIVYYKDTLNYQRHIIHRMGTSTLCTVSIHNVVYT